MNQKLFNASLSALGMMILILDAKTALSGAVQGIELCIRTLVPSLFPFFIVSILLTDSLLGLNWKWLHSVGKLLKIPQGSEPLLLVGFLGGYPAGAQSVTQAWESGAISTSCARRMLGFCNNAGPSFLFGFVAFQFDNWYTAWILWGIHVLSAFITGMLLPGKSEEPTILNLKKSITLNDALYRSLRIMGAVCGWVILFRVVLAFADRWFLWACSKELQTAIHLATELASGCIALPEIEDYSTRMLLCSCALSLGGFCVLLQTISVTGKLGSGAYLRGKLTQTLISATLCCGYLSICKNIRAANYVAIGGTVLLIGAVFLQMLKNKSRNSQKAVV